MKNKIYLLFCDYFQAEIEWLLKSNPYPDVKAGFYHADCDKTRQADELIQLITQYTTHAEVIIFSGFCLSSMLKQNPQLAVQIEPLEVCFELLLPQPLLQQTLVSGAHLFTNGMLKYWTQVSQNWGFTAQDRQAFFAEGTTKLLLLHAPPLPADTETMKNVAAQLNLPWETLEVSLEPLKHRIFSVIQPWHDKISTQSE